MQANNMYNNVAVIQNIFEQTKNNQQIFSNMQSNVKGNNLYSNSFQQTWNNFQLNADINKTNMNNMLNILALINFPILVPYHSLKIVIHIMFHHFSALLVNLIYVKNVYYHFRLIKLLYMILKKK